jgi:hypothetical protein
VVRHRARDRRYDSDPAPCSRLNDDTIPLTTSNPIDLLACDVSLLSECGNTNWLLKMAHCFLGSKTRLGVLWTHRTGTTFERVNRLFHVDIWQEIPLGALLEVKLYEYYTSRDAQAFLAHSWYRGNGAPVSTALQLCSIGVR